MLAKIIDWIKFIFKNMQTKIKVYFGGVYVGDATSLRVIDGSLGWPLKVSTSNLRLNSSKLTQVFIGSSMISRIQQYPLELRIEEKNFTVVFKNCWMTDFSSYRKLGDWAIITTAEWDSELVKVEGV
jgi:hypothetical protein